MVNFALLFKPSTEAAKIWPRAWNQLSKSGRWRRNMRATFFIGPICDRMTKTHHSSRNASARPRDQYCQNGCESAQDWKNAKCGAAFSCVSCGELLRIPDSYTKRIGIISGVVSLVLLYTTGYRGWAFCS